MITPGHICKSCFRHVTADAARTNAACLMPGMGDAVGNHALMARQTSLIAILRCKADSPGRCVTMKAIKLFVTITRVQQPTRERIVFTKITAIRIVVRTLKGRQIVMVEEALRNFIARTEWSHFGVTWRAHLNTLDRIHLRDLQNLWIVNIVDRQALHLTGMYGRITMTTFAVDAWLFPTGVVAVSCSVVVGVKLAYVATVAGSVKSES